jgi:transcriptional antiterminator
MLNRLKYDIQLGNPLLEEIQELFPQMLGICQIVMELLSRKYHLKKIVIDEIAYIATYYQTMLRHVVTPKNVLVVCHSGYGTSQLLAAKLKHEFSFITIVDVVSSRRIESMDLNGIEFIVSTVPINVRSIPHIVVSALLTEQDIQDIKNSFQTSTGNNSGNRYFKCIPTFINVKNIFINEASELFTVPKENLIAETDLLPDLYVQVREAEKSEVFVHLSNKEQGKEKIKIILSVSDEGTLKFLLSDIYKLSVLKKDLDTLKESASVEDVAGFFEERGL